MSHIAVELKVIEVRAPNVARAAAISEDRSLAGLVRLWHRAWSVEAEVITRTQIAGVFGPERIDEIIDALCSEGLLEPHDAGWRIKGADRYLRLKSARRAGAAKTNENRRSAHAQRTLSDGPAHAGRPLPNALSPSTEHRAPSTELKATAAAAATLVVVPLPQKPANRFESGEAYFAWLQNERHEAGFVTEKPPAGLSGWFSEIMLELNGDGDRLDATVRAFALDPYWRKQNAPMRALMSQWRRYVPKAVAS